MESFDRQHWCSQVSRSKGGRLSSSVVLDLDATDLMQFAGRNFQQQSLSKFRKLLLPHPCKKKIAALSHGFTIFERDQIAELLNSDRDGENVFEWAGSEGLQPEM